MSGTAPSARTSSYCVIGYVPAYHSRLKHKKRKTDFSAFRLMREMGLEPTRPIGHKILSLACLPISALPRDKVYISTAEGSWQQLFSFFFFASGTFWLPLIDRGQTPSRPRYEGALSAMGSDPVLVPVRGRFICDGVRPLSLPVVHGTCRGQTLRPPDRLRYGQLV